MTSLGKAFEVARGSPVASLLVPVAMREQGLSSKLLAFVKQLEDHEVAVLELERQVAVLELGEKFKRLLDLVNETRAMECERQLAMVEIEANFKRLSHQVVLTGTMAAEFEQFRHATLTQCTITKLQALEEAEVELQQLTDAIVLDLADVESDALNEVDARCGDWSLQHDRLMVAVGHRLQQLEAWAYEVAGDDGCG